MKSLIAVLAFCSFSTAQAATVTVTININGLKNPQGQILLAAYSQPEGFPDDATPVQTAIIKQISNSQAQVTMRLPAGVYAFNFVHDENRNGKLDTGLFGIPTEGFGFSNNPKISFGAPKFKSCAVLIDANRKSISMKTVYF